MSETNDVSQLNSFLRGELSAVETYDQCIRKIQDVAVKSQLESLRASHRRRAALLEQRIRTLGGEPAEDSGLWGGVAKIVEGSAGIFGDSAAVSALEEGEDHGLNDYRQDLSKLSFSERQFVEEELLPEQVRPHNFLLSIDDRM
jgi:demethoxyubiquinone hydroxylase (CLK1/Coq7/Cat5 family)